MHSAILKFVLHDIDMDVISITISYQKGTGEWHGVDWLKRN